MIPTYPRAEVQVPDTYTPDGIPLAPLLPVAFLIVGLVLGYLLSWGQLQRLTTRIGWLVRQLDETRAALESEQARAHRVEVRLQGDLTAARAEAEVARGLAEQRGALLSPTRQAIQNGLSGAIDQHGRPQ